MNTFTSRQVNLLGFIVAIGLIAFGFYLQIFQGIQPCPLCIIQRFIFILIGIVLLIAAAHNPRKKGLKIYGILILIVALLGLVTAGRHVWLQLQPYEEAGVCAPGLLYLVENFPWPVALKSMVLGTADCAHVSWSFLGLSMPAWSFIFFAFFAMLGFIQTKWGN